jgi:uncharacterized protein (TIGR03067 family)
MIAREDSMVLPLLFLTLIPVRLPEGIASDAADTEEIQGDWKVVSGEEDGKAQPVPPGLLWSFKNGTLIMKINHKVVGAGRYELAEAGRVKHLKLVAIPPDAQMGDTTELPEHLEIETLPVLAICGLSGDTLTICAAKPGKPRPKAFSTKKGDGCVLMVLKRIRHVEAPPRR